MKLYLSGPMTGLVDHNFPAFDTAASELRALGYDVVNPADGSVHAAKCWADYLREDLRFLLDCDGVALLPGWVRSRGAKLERYVACELGMPVARLSTWRRNADRVEELVQELTS